MKLSAHDNNRYSIQLEPGDTLYVAFDPHGFTVAPGGSAPVMAMTISTILPRPSFLALGVAFDKEFHHKGEYNERGEFDALCQSDADKMEFEVSGEAPREILYLRRVGELTEE